MTIKELNHNLDKIISEYEAEAGKACSYCSDIQNGEALFASHKATTNALSGFKAEILTYLTQSNT